MQIYAEKCKGSKVFLYLFIILGRTKVLLVTPKQRNSNPLSIIPMLSSICAPNPSCSVWEIMCNLVEIPITKHTLSTSTFASTCSVEAEQCSLPAETGNC